MTEYSGATMITFCLRAFSIKNPPGRLVQNMHSAVVDWIICAAPMGSFFLSHVFTIVFTPSEMLSGCTKITKVIEHKATELLPNESPTLCSIPFLSGGDALITE